MTKKELLELEEILKEEVVNRRKLGDYSQEAPAIRLLCETNLALVKHLRGKATRK